MKVICPKCQYKGVVDAPAAASESRPLCPKCAGPMIDVLSSGAARQAAPASLPVARQAAAASAAADPPRVNSSPVPEVVATLAVEADACGGWETPAEVGAARSLTSRFAEWSTSLRESFVSPRRSHSLASDRHKLFLLRLSPVIILLGGLIWLSLYTLSGFLTERGGELFNQVSAHQRVANNQASNQSPAGDAAPSSDDEAITADEAEPSAEETAAAPGAGRTDEGFTLQVGSYNENVQANEQCARLNEAGVAARMVRAEIPRRGTWYRVQVGHFASREEAARVGEQLKSDGTAEEFIVTEVAAN